MCPFSEYGLCHNVVGLWYNVSGEWKVIEGEWHIKLFIRKITNHNSCFSLIIHGHHNQDVLENSEWMQENKIENTESYNSYLYLNAAIT